MVCCFYQLVLKKNMEFITNELKYVWFKSVMIKILWICFVLFSFGQLFACFGSKFIVVVFHQIILFKGSFVFLRLEFFMGVGRRPIRVSGKPSKPRQRGGRELVSYYGLNRLEPLVSVQCQGGGWASPSHMPTSQQAALVPSPVVQLWLRLPAGASTLVSQSPATLMPPHAWERSFWVPNLAVPTSHPGLFLSSWAKSELLGVVCEAGPEP